MQSDRAKLGAPRAPSPTRSPMHSLSRRPARAAARVQSPPPAGACASFAARRGHEPHARPQPGDLRRCTSSRRRQADGGQPARAMHLQAQGRARKGRARRRPQPRAARRGRGWRWAHGGIARLATPAEAAAAVRRRQSTGGQNRGAGAPAPALSLQWLLKRPGASVRIAFRHGGWTRSCGADWPRWMITGHRWTRGKLHVEKCRKMQQRNALECMHSSFGSMRPGFSNRTWVDTRAVEKWAHQHFCVDYN